MYRCINTYMIHKVKSDPLHRCIHGVYKNRTELGTDKAELVDVVVAGEERLAGQQLGEDAADGLGRVRLWGGGGGD